MMCPRVKEVEKEADWMAEVKHARETCKLMVLLYVFCSGQHIL